MTLEDLIETASRIYDDAPAGSTLGQAIVRTLVVIGCGP